MDARLAKGGHARQLALVEALPVDGQATRLQFFLGARLRLGPLPAGPAAARCLRPLVRLALALLPRARRGERVRRLEEEVQAREVQQLEKAGP